MHRLAAFLLLTLIASGGIADDNRPNVVMLIAEREYETEKSLPEFAQKYLGSYDVTFVFADPEDQNRLDGIEAVKTADLLLVSVRRRTLPTDQLQIVRNYVQAGKPVVGIRTANHAFCLRGKEPAKGRAQWTSWDQDVFGGNYTNHYGNKLETTYQLNDDASQAIATGITSGKSYTAGGSLYKVAPLADRTTVILTGAVDGNPPEPIAWTFKRDDGGKSFYTSLGHVDDFKGDVLPRLLVNAIGWALTKS